MAVVPDRQVESRNGDAAQPMLSAILRAKFSPPVLPRNIAGRERLMSWLAKVMEHRVTLVKAPAGYGKSSFAAMLAEDARSAGVAVAWISFVAEDNEAVAIGYISEAIRLATYQMPRDDADSILAPPLAAMRLLNSIAELDQPILLVIDNIDVIRDPQLVAGISSLIVQAPSNLSILLSGRSETFFALEQTDLSGSLLSVGTADLALTDAEAAILLADCGLRADFELCAELNRCLAGWPAALKLAASRMQGGEAFAAGNCDKAVANLLDRHFRLALRDCSPSDLEALRKIAIAGDTNREFAVALAGENAPDLLQHLTEHSLFVDMPPGIGQHFTLHPALCAWLLRDVAPDSIASDHRAAAHWLFKNGRLDAAIDHALRGGDLDTACLALSNAGMRFVRESQLSLLVGWLAQLPEGMFARRPELLRIRAWACLLSANDQAESAIAAYRLHGAASVFEAEALAILYDGLLHDRLEIAMDASEDWLARNEGLAENDFAEHMIRALVAHGAVRRGQFSLMHEMVRPIMLHARKQAPDIAFALALAAKAHGCRAQGQLSEAERILASALGEMSKLPVAAAIIAASLARCLYERGEIDAADALSSTAHQQLESSCFQAAHCEAVQVAMRVSVMKRRKNVAAALAERAEIIGFERNWMSLKAVSIVERMRLGLPFSLDPEQLVPAATELALAENPLSSAASAFAILSEARAYEAIMLGDRPRLTVVAGHLLNLAANTDNMELRARATLFNILPQLSGRCDKMVDIETVRFLNHAASTGFMRTLVDLLDVTGVRAVQNFCSEAYASGSFLALLNLADPSRRDPRLEGQHHLAPGEAFSFLTEREIEILGALKAGESNKEIARALKLTPETVKWHLKNVMRKLRATTRQEAVQNASTLGLKMAPETRRI